MMTKTTLMATALAATLTACDRPGGTAGDEHRDRDYRAAMVDYSAGRLADAVKGFGRAIANDPASASARFQLACLLQDHVHDPFGALCEYREYLRLAPGSDKESVVRERMAICEKTLAVELATRHALTGENATLVAEVDRLRQATAAERKRADGLAESLEASVRKTEALERELARYRKLLEDTHGEESQTASVPVGVKELLDEDEEEGDRLKLSEDAKRLRAEEESETAGEDQRTPFPVEPGKDRPKARPEPPHEERPETYEVQEGDTLYKIAIRFYGRTSAWSEIRDANKTLISTDGRIRTGQVLRLP